MTRAVDQPTGSDLKKRVNNSSTKPEWLLLVHQLPPQPTNLRVRIWRKLQKLGAVVVKNSVYTLPFNEKTYEDFQWLKQEIEAAGGEATVFRAGSIGGAADKEIIAAFRKARDDDYTQVTAELDGLTGALREQRRGGHLSISRIGHHEAELAKLRKELDRISSTDFFRARGRVKALAAYERGHKALQTAQDRKEQSKPNRAQRTRVNRSEFQGRRWVTRRDLFVDRLAAIWLIKRFIDPRPRFFFIEEGETVEGALGFDLYGAEFSHRGEDCTFETMLEEFGLTGDAGLRGLAEIVHDLDLKDQKFNRTEAAGLGAVIRGMADTLKNDRKLAQHCGPIFDGLYELLGREDETRTRNTRRKRRSAGKSGRRTPRN
jgi:hypothetical protein